MLAALLLLPVSLTVSVAAGPAWIPVHPRAPSIEHQYDLSIRENFNDTSRNLIARAAMWFARATGSADSDSDDGIVETKAYEFDVNPVNKPNPKLISYQSVVSYISTHSSTPTSTPVATSSAVSKWTSSGSAVSSAPFTEKPSSAAASGTPTTVESASSTTSSTSSTWTPITTGVPLETFSLTWRSSYSTVKQAMKLLSGTFGWSENTVSISQGVAKKHWAYGVSKANNGSAFYVSYPKGSLTPSTGAAGIGFYASPLDLSNAYNVTFGYSVFFPKDFDFVLGGKLPGLYGGSKTCSGGASASNCFSARMMWRTNGAGELYLYAPRKSQSRSLCSTPPLTYCSTTDGMSVGRGAFAFRKGGWTHIRQDIWLNTPGVADGGFNIWVDGKLVIHNNATYYRGTSSSSTSVKSVSMKVLYDSTVNTGTSAGTLPQIEDFATPFRVASSCQSQPATNTVYLNGAVEPNTATTSSLSSVPTWSSATLTAKTSSHATSSATSQKSQKNLKSLLGTVASSDASYTMLKKRQTFSDDTTVKSETLNAHLLARAATTAASASSTAVGSDAARNPDRPWGFAGIMHQSFFGGSSWKWAAQKHEVAYFNNYEMMINL